MLLMKVPLGSNNHLAACRLISNQHRHMVCWVVSSLCTQVTGAEDSHQPALKTKIQFSLFHATLDFSKFSHENWQARKKLQLQLSWGTSCNGGWLHTTTNHHWICINSTVSQVYYFTIYREKVTWTKNGSFLTTLRLFLLLFEAVVVEEV